MRREILTEFATAIIDFENKNISIVQKQWKFRISVPMSYITFWEITLNIWVIKISQKKSTTNVPGGHTFGIMGHKKKY